MENDCNFENDRRSCILNNILTSAFWIGTSAILAYNHLYMLLAEYAIFFIFFPIAYVLMKFSISDCINKQQILDSGMDCDAVMMFKDERRNMKIDKFMKNEMMNANFWFVIISLGIAYVGFAWK